MLICQLTDLHMRPPGLAANRVSETNMFAERAFRKVASLAPRPDVVVITGDLTERGMEGGYANLARLIRRYLPMPVYVTTGNHDQREQLRSGLQHLPGVVADPHYVQYAVDDLPVRIVMLDTLVPGSAHGILTDAQLAWLDKTLSAVTDKPTMIGMHHPPFACGVGYMDRINLRNAAAFTALIARHKQVQRVICGHHHRCIVTHVAQAIGSICPSVAHQVELSFHPDDPGAFLFEPPAFQLHRWDPADGFVTHTVYVEDFPGPYPFLSEVNSSKPR
ncbi:MAG TPA: phosphodiesterase [Acetobacteraceae bacterium]|nr:phosphodiesterase [Acetobacteraceae bacterium]